MKRRIATIAILAVLLLCGVVWARMTTVVVGQGVSGAAGNAGEFNIVGATYFAVAPSGYSYNSEQDTNYSTRKYNTLFAAEAALSASPSTPQVINIIGTWGSADTTAVNFDGTTTSGANYILVRTVAATGSRHSGVYATSNIYRLEGSSDWTNVLTVSDDNVKLDGLCVGLSGNYA